MLPWELLILGTACLAGAQGAEAPETYRFPNRQLFKAMDDGKLQASKPLLEDQSGLIAPSQISNYRKPLIMVLEMTR